jgi:thiamine transporter
MNNFFVTTQGAWDDGSVRLKTIGIVLVVIVIALLVIVAALLRQRENATQRTKLTTKQLVYSAAALALAMVCSMIKFANLPMGGSVTLFSMLFVTLIGYWYGPYVGIMTGIAYGLIQFVMEPIFYTVPQMLLDYPLAFGALGLSGFFYKNKKGLQLGYIVGVIGRYIFAVISGVVFFGSYAPEGTPALVYSLTYNATYLLPEAIVTLIFISIAPVSKALAYVKRQASESASVITA